MRGTDEDDDDVRARFGHDRDCDCDECNQGRDAAADDAYDRMMEGRDDE